jgi:hypothetical protein
MTAPRREGGVAMSGGTLLIEDSGLGSRIAFL